MRQRMSLQPVVLVVIPVTSCHQCLLNNNTSYNLVREAGIVDSAPAFTDKDNNSAKSWSDGKDFEYETEPQNTTDTDDRQENAIEIPLVPAK